MHRLGKSMIDVALSLWRSGSVYVIVIVSLVGVLWLVYRQTATPVILLLDGQPFPYRTHQSSVAGLLQEIGLSLEPADVIVPPLDSPMAGGDSIMVQRASLFSIEADGMVIPYYSHAKRVADLLHEAGIRFDSHDLVLWKRQPIGFEATLPRASVWTDTAPGTIGSTRRLPPRPAVQHLTIRRAVPLHIHDGALEGEIYSVALTVGEALYKQGIVLYVGDQVNPGLSTRLSAGLHVYVKRSIPAEIVVDGRQIRTRTQARTVGELLAQEGVALLGKDIVEPADTAPVVESMSIRIVRVREEFAIEEESIPFESVWEPDSELEIDQQRLRQAGEEGIIKRRVRLRSEDGLEIARTMEDEWMDREPQTKILNYGTKIVLRTLETPDGTFEYWRRVRMLATSYTAATSGKTRDHPQYGITFLGWPMRRGIVAVDPAVLSLRSDVYVFGYGQGVAGDTGGGIKGRRIDLGYEEDNPLALTWYRWVDVYLLAPAPPSSSIRWVLPNWPVERK